MIIKRPTRFRTLQRNNASGGVQGRLLGPYSKLVERLGPPAEYEPNQKQRRARWIIRFNGWATVEDDLSDCDPHPLVERPHAWIFDDNESPNAGPVEQERSWCIFGTCPEIVDLVAHILDQPAWRERPAPYVDDEDDEE
jgi:hypothetical protein